MYWGIGRFALPDHEATSISGMVNEVVDNRFHNHVWNTWLPPEIVAPQTNGVPLSGAQSRLRKP